MSHDLKDVNSLRMVRTELSKRGVDTTRADVRVFHGICQIHGTLSPVKGVATYADLKIEMEHIRHILRQKPGINDVVLDCQYQTA